MPSRSDLATALDDYRELRQPKKPTDQAATSNPETPWYRSLQGRDFSFSSLARTPVGRTCTAAATRWLERLHIAPEGASEAPRS